MNFDTPWRCVMVETDRSMIEWKDKATFPIICDFHVIIYRRRRHCCFWARISQRCRGKIDPDRHWYRIPGDAG